MNHVVDGRTIVFRTGAASPLGLLASREPVKVEVDDDETTSTSAGWRTRGWWARSSGSTRTFGIRSIRHRPRGRRAGSRRGCASCPPASPGWSSSASRPRPRAPAGCQHPARRDAVRTDHRRGGRVHHQRSSVRASRGASPQPATSPSRSSMESSRTTNRRDPGLAPTAPSRRPRSLGRGAPRVAVARPQRWPCASIWRATTGASSSAAPPGRSRRRAAPRSHRRGDHEPRPAATAAPRPTASQPRPRRSVVPDHRPRQRTSELTSLESATEQLDLDLQQGAAAARRRHPP